MKQIAILGGGIAGLSIGYYLAKNGFEIQVFEREGYYGGLARSFKWHGFSCDFAAHRFFTNDESTKMSVFKLVPMLRHIRRSTLYIKDNWLNDPINPAELLKVIPFKEAIELTGQLLQGPKPVTNAVSFEDYTLGMYGSYLLESFFRPSTEKLFRIPANQISVIWAQKKARLVNPFKKVDTKSRKYFASFYYPLEGGYGAICDAFYREIADKVHLNTEVRSILREDGKVVGVETLRDGVRQLHACDTVISTLPLPVTGKMLGLDIPLGYQKVDAVYLWINKPEAGLYHWVYFIDTDVSINRMVEFKHMSRYDCPEDTTVLCAEVTEDIPDPAGKVISDLVRSGYIRTEDVLDTLVVREDTSYPIYYVGYEKIVEQAYEGIRQTAGMHILGRSAEFIHYEADDIIGKSKELTRDFLVAEGKNETEMIFEVEPSDDVCIIVLTYNNISDTLECLASLQVLEGGPYKTYLVDNGSVDDTITVIRSRYPEVEIIALGSNYGVSTGFNKGIQQGLSDRYKYVLILNNDTVSDPQMVTEMLRVAKNDIDCAIVMPRICYYPPREGPITRTEVWADGGYFRRFPPAIKLKDDRKNIDFNQPRKVDYAPTCGLLFHRRVFENIGLLDEGYFLFYEDWDFCERVKKNGLNIWCAPQAILWHKVSRTTRRDMTFYWQKFGESAGRFFKRHYSPFEQAIHLGYITVRDFFFKPRNFKYLGVFCSGVKRGRQGELDTYPDIANILYNQNGSGKGEE